MASPPDPDGLFDVYIEGPECVSVAAFSKQKLPDVENMIEKFEKDFEKFEELDIDDEDARDKALEKMEPFYEGCDIVLKDSEGNSWMWVDGWDFIGS